VDSSGRASYQSEAKVQPNETPGEPYIEKFNMSNKTTAHIFETADSLDHFQGSFEYKGGTRMAQTGIKTLRYEANGKKSETSFNYSENRQLMELTDLFQGISLTMEMGRQLRHAQRFDKLGVDALLKSLEQAEKDKRAFEIQAIAPMLQKIADDRLCMNIARQTARRLIAAAGVSGSQ
jgi:hypothetical protein